MDVGGNLHLYTKRVPGAFYYDTKNEPWTTPVASLLNGYDIDGIKYTAGVQDAGPVYAPWYSEAFSITRGYRSTFPERSLITWDEHYITIFDVTNFPTDLAVWMRFDVTSTYMVQQGVSGVKMVNGVMVVASPGTTSDGYMTLIDFKATVPENVGHTIKYNGHWRWTTTLADRNTSSKWTTSGVSPSLRISCNHLYGVEVHRDNGANVLRVLLAGDDNTDMLLVDDSDGMHPTTVWPTLSVDRPTDLDHRRCMVVDDKDGLWLSENNLLTCNYVRWKTAGPVLETHDRKCVRGSSRHWKTIALPEDILSLASARNYVYCGTAHGVYRVHRGSFHSERVYTIAGGGGGGKDGSPPTGELLLGNDPVIRWLYSFSTNLSSYLSVATSRGVATIRLWDDVVLQRYTYNQLCEKGALFNTAVLERL